MNPLLVNYVLANYNSLVKKAGRLNNNRQKGKDTVQELMVKILSKPIELKNEKMINSYVLNSLKNLCLNDKKDYKKEKLGVRTSHEEDLFENTEENEKWEDLAEDMELFNKVMFFAEEKLPPAQLKALKSSLEQDTIEKINIKGISFETAKASRRNAILKIKEHFVK